MNTEEVAKQVVELTRKQAWKEALDTLYDKDIMSVEARTMDGSSPETRGIEGPEKYARDRTQVFGQTFATGSEAGSQLHDRAGLSCRRAGRSTCAAA